MTEEQVKIAAAYQSCFGSDSGLLVLKDLSEYCFENENTFTENRPDVQNVKNGKRAVILKIRKMMNLNLSTRASEPKPKDENYI